MKDYKSLLFLLALVMLAAGCDEEDNDDDSFNPHNPDSVTCENICARSAECEGSYIYNACLGENYEKCLDKCESDSDCLGPSSLSKNCLIETWSLDCDAYISCLMN